MPHGQWPRFLYSRSRRLFRLEKIAMTIILERLTAPKTSAILMMTTTIRKRRRGAGRSGGGSVANRSTTTAMVVLLLHHHFIILAFLWMMLLQVGDCTGDTTAAAAAAFCFPAFWTISLQQQQQQKHEEISTRRRRKHECSHHVLPTALWAKKVKSTQNKKQGGTGAGGFGGGVSRPSAAASTASSTSTSSSTSSTSFGTGAKALRNAANNYDAIRKRDGLTAACRDVYVRSTLHNNPNLFWFVGKIARQLSPEPAVSSLSSTLASSEQATTAKTNSKHENVDECDECCCTEFFMQAALFQKRLILDYSKMQLRPQNFGGKYAQGLELWLAPADSEMNVATNKVSLCRVVRTTLRQADDDNVDDDDDGPPACSILTVGYNPEIYLGDEIAHGGLRVERDENGNPTKAAFDVNESL
jgi:hypothetical protein